MIILDILDNFSLKYIKDCLLKQKTSHCDNTVLINALNCLKVFEILQYFLTEKMDGLTKQLFDDIQKEESQRMYGI